MFQIPLLNAEVHMSGVVFSNCIFYYSNFLIDTYSGTGTPYKKVFADSIKIINCVFIQSTLFTLTNVKAFTLSNLIISNSTFVG